MGSQVNFRASLDLMPNHVHLIVVPKTKESLNLAISEIHRRYSRMINFRKGWRGHLWQGRFASFIMDEPYFLACARYIELNPVRARMVKQAEEWQWSSAKAHIDAKNDGIVKASFLLERMSITWKTFLSSDVKTTQIKEFQKHERTGRPLGGDSFVEKLEVVLGRKLKLGKPGPKKKN
ncbi:MAG: transposase [Pseudomonadota bacterium]